MTNRKRTNHYPVDGIRYDLDRAQAWRQAYQDANPDMKFRVAGTSSLGYHVEVAAANKADAEALGDEMVWPYLTPSR